MKLLHTKDGVAFVRHRAFAHRFLLPIGEYVNWKLQHEWDDYNELYHAVHFIEQLSAIDGLWLEPHTLEKEGKLMGVLFIVGGMLEKLGDAKKLDEGTLLLKYFHIVSKGNGYGSYWLQRVIVPHYRERGFRAIAISSSHPKSFNFYSKLAQETASYCKASDNGIYQRPCKSFKLSLLP